MIARLRGALALDLDQLDLRRGLVGLLAILAALLVIVLFGTAGMTAGLAVLFVIAADAPGGSRDRAQGVVVMTVAGAAIAALAVWAGTDSIWFATLLTVVITAAATLGAGYGSTWAMRGLLLSLWTVLALSVAGQELSALELAAAYALGGIIAGAVLVVGPRDGGEAAVADGKQRPERTLMEIVRSPLGLFSLVRAAAVGLATALGIGLFPEHPVWAALTVLLVLRPRLGETIETGVLRTLGTLGGVLAAVGAVAAAGGSDAVVVVSFLVAAFGMMALKEVNYAVYVLFVTAVLVLLQDLLGESATAAAEQRLLATLLGAAIAFVALWIGLRTEGRVGANAPHGTEG